MCGIAGFWDAQKRFLIDEKLPEQMAAKISPRGPDSHGVWLDHQHGIALAHRRLSIVDLSPAGQQPMESPSGRFMMVYNGEIFNGDDLKVELGQISLKGHSDTETMLACFDKWGIEASVKKFIGMFAFAVWDRQEKSLTLVRDRIGIKPLYLGFFKGVWLFGSQPKALMAHPAWESVLDANAVGEFLRFGYVPEGISIFKNLQKLKPGGMISLHPDGTSSKTIYWDLSDEITTAKNVQTYKTDEEWIEATHSLLQDAVKRRCLADVPLGAFLSGGIDSSLVVSLMQAQSATPIKTFSIGFSEADYNEAPFAKQVAGHLITDHHEFYVTPKQAQEVIPNLTNMFDEPFADVSQIPTYLVSRLARDHVTVCLSGDGGDELFAGYTRYTLGEKLWKYKNQVPSLLKNCIPHLRHVPVGLWNILEKFPGTPTHLGDKIKRGIQLVEAKNLEDCYRMLVSHWEIDTKTQFSPHPKLSDSIENFQYWDLLSYLPGDILTKVDRASMHASLEARVPLLDHRLIALAWTLPSHLKLRNGQGKWILREILQKYVPKSLFDRPKMGFGVPIDAWLRSSLKDWAYETLHFSPLEEFGLDKQTIEATWQRHQSGLHNEQYKLWLVLMLQQWRKEYGV